MGSQVGVKVALDSTLASTDLLFVSEVEPCKSMIMTAV
jgi:hypothetical protein